MKFNLTAILAFILLLMHMMHFPPDSVCMGLALGVFMILGVEFYEIINEIREKIFNGDKSGKHKSRE